MVFYVRNKRVSGWAVFFHTLAVFLTGGLWLIVLFIWWLLAGIKR